MDFVLALFPWLTIYNLQMRRVEKLGVGIAMSMGILYVLSPSLCPQSCLLTGHALLPTLGLEPQVSSRQCTFSTVSSGQISHVSELPSDPILLKPTADPSPRHSPVWESHHLVMCRMRCYHRRRLCACLTSHVQGDPDKN
jgi:hypothetical protein